MEAVLYVLIIGIFVALILMRWTLRMSRRERDGLRWRGIDWTGVKLPEKQASSEVTSENHTSASQDSDGSKGD